MPGIDAIFFILGESITMLPVTTTVQWSHSPEVTRPPYLLNLLPVISVVNINLQVIDITLTEYDINSSYLKHSLACVFQIHIYQEFFFFFDTDFFDLCL